MVHYLKLYAATFIGFLAIDFLWLAFVARTFYRQHLGFLLADQPNWWAAAAFYLLFVAGLVVFITGESTGIGIGRHARCTCEGGWPPLHT